jgi:hypothetical protein
VSSLWTALKAAFTWHWNLLALGAGVAAAVISGPLLMTILPLVLAAEVAYLGLRSTSARFRNVIEARRLAARNAAAPAQQLESMLGTLPEKARTRFEELRDQCLSLQDLARRLRSPGTNGPPSTLTSMRLESLDRLLWMFLKILYSRDALARFLAATDRQKLSQEVAVAAKALDAARKENRSEKLIATLEDSLGTLKQRQKNVETSYDNLELLDAELNRIEQKVRAISETALSAQTAEDVGVQVDSIADGVASTEEALRGLDVMPHLMEEAAPSILRQSQPAPAAEEGPSLTEVRDVLTEGVGDMVRKKLKH